MVAVTQLVIIITSLMQCASQINLDPIQINNKLGQIQCTWNDQSGVCVDPSVCHENHTIIQGGEVHYTDLRSKSVDPCTNKNHWCCTSEVIPLPPIKDNCQPLKTDVCPWCVLLYTDENQISPFCLGALVGTKVIITAATCFKAAQSKKIYVQVPISANPEKYYTELTRAFHPNYNTGSHEYDFGVMVIDSEVTFVDDTFKGACIDFDAPLGDCVGYGFDNKGIITSTLLNVKKNSCGKRGSSKDALCGSSSDNVCIVAGGGPVICQKENNGEFNLIGIARGICNKKDQVTLGDISQSKKWLEEKLESLNISKNAYNTYTKLN